MGNKRSILNLVEKPSHLNTLSDINLYPLQSPLVPKTPAIIDLTPVRSEQPPTHPPRTSTSHFYATTETPTQKIPPPAKPSPVKKRASFSTENYGLPKELGGCIHRDVEFLKSMGWNCFVNIRCNRGDISNLSNIDNHPFRRLLRLYKHQGMPVKFSSPKWIHTKIKYALSRGAH